MICDQFIDRTTGRADTYYRGPDVVHISAADPYCPELRALAGRIAGQQSLRWRPAGTVVVVQGPRFSTRAESRWYSRMGWDIVGMTQYPEVILARELEMCYLNLCLVTDYDAGLEGAPEVGAVQAHDVMRVLAENIVRVRDLLAATIPMIPAEPSCNCQRSLEAAGYKKKKGRDWGLGLQGRGSGITISAALLRTGEEAVTALSRLTIEARSGVSYSPQK